MIIALACAAGIAYAGAKAPAMDQFAPFARTANE